MDAPTMIACPDEDHLLEHARSQGSGPIAEHIDRCAECSDLLVAYAQLLSSVSSVSLPGSVEPDDHGMPLPGDRLGRYHLLERLGRGTMGIVYLAHDPDLDRRVALKVVAPMLRAGQAIHTAQARLLREAKVAARLLHPNVVAVHDCGTFGDRVFVAMEYVDGTTLDAWLAAAPRDRNAILEVVIGAARGLAAAHRVGLIHRDVKPANILVGKDGVAKLGDFGLAAASRDSTSGDEPLDAPRGLHGTPAYMAPESLAGDSADPRSDQFALCVTIYEALVGERPFRGDNLSALSAAITRGMPPRPTSLRRSLYGTLRRGLAARPQDRFPAVDELSIALGRRSSRAARNIGVTACATAAIVGIAWVMTPASSDERCPSPRPELVTVWHEAHARGLRARHPADSRVDVIVASFDQYASQWAVARMEACRDTRERGAYSEAVLDQRSACLARARQKLTTLVSLLLDADGDDLDRAVAAAQSLPPLERCSDIQALGKRVAPAEPAIAEQVRRDRTEVDRAFALADLGRSAQAFTIVDEIAHARPPAYRPLEAELAYVRGITLSDLDRLDDARAAYEQAHQAARAAGDEVLEVQCALELAGLLRGPNTRKDAQLWLGHASAVLEHLADDRLKATLHERRGVLAYEGGEYAAAASDLSVSLALREKVYGSAHKNTALVRSSLGGALAKIGRTDEGRAALEMAIRDLGAARGAGHASLGSMWNSLGSLEMKVGRDREAGSAFEKARQIYIASFGAEHRTVAMVDINLATIAQHLEDLDAAEPRLRSALAFFVKAGEGEGLQALIARAGLVKIALKRHDFRTAETSARELVASFAKLQGAEHVNVGRARFDLAMTLLSTDRLTLAERELRAARPLYAKAHGAASPEVAMVDEKLAVVAAQGRDWTAAAALAEPLRARTELHPEVRASVRFVMARVALARRDRDQAERLAREAISILDPGDSEAAVITRWLRDQGLSALPARD